ncbi:MAG: hypothetical protein LW869_07470 [Actinobacteria bacterium]|nr:hypothetical protein [Actinomycetota bacterium]
MRVAFVTTIDQDAIHDDVDLPLQVTAFADSGIELVHAPWEDRTVDWESFDLVVVRSPWNYVDRLDEFRHWLDARRHMRTIHNPVSLIEWNMDKRYLADLAGRGVPIVPTEFAESMEQFQVAAASAGSSEIVVKPSVSAGSRLTGRFAVEDPVVEELASRILAKGFAVMVQPFASRIDDHGEIGTVLFDGMVSHSFRKAALLAEGGALVGGGYREEITAIVAPDDVLAVVEVASIAVTTIARERGWLAGNEELLYGRYDVIRLDDGSPALLEAELFEPCFFLPTDSEAPRRFIEAVGRRMPNS